MPSWKELLTALCDEASCRVHLQGDARRDACLTSIDSGDFEVAASILKELFLPADFDQVMQDQFSARRLADAPSDVREEQICRLRHLADGPWAGIVTTNYDTLIETALADRVVNTHDERTIPDGATGFGDREVVIVHGNDCRIGTILARPPVGGFFVKVHGSISGSDVVLSTADYDRTYLATPRMTSFLTALMLRYHIVFIGCSLEDEIVRLRRKLAAEFGRLIPVAYALMPDSVKSRRYGGWLRSHAVVDSIFYTPDDLHLEVGEFLRQASECADWALRRDDRSSAITNELRERNVAERLRAIGEANIRLLRLIARQNDHVVDHIELVELDRLATSKTDACLYRLSPEERVYRTLFLVSVGLVDQVSGDTGLPRYRVRQEIVDALSS